MLSRKAAIVGIGATDFSKDSGRSELRLAAEAVRDALDDAGLTPADVDGLTTFTMDTNKEIAVARAAGIGELSSSPRPTTAAVPHARPSSMPRWRWRPGWPTSSSRTGRSTSGPGCGSVRCRPGWWETLARRQIRRPRTTPSHIHTGFRRPRRR